MIRSRILGTGRAVPSRVLANAELERMVDTTDAWIVERTGIRERRLLEPELATSDLAAQAGREACAAAGVRPAELDCIIVGTVTPDMPMPATAVFVQQKLGAGACPAFDLSAACAGFLYGLSVADAFVRCGQARRVLVVGVEILSRIVDWQDRNTCVLFGDGAGAVVLGPEEQEEAARPRGLLSVRLFADGAGWEHLLIPGGGTRAPASAETVAGRQHFVRMNGRAVFSHAVRNIAAACQAALSASAMTAADVDLVIAHQANLRIVEGVAQRLGLPLERFFLNIHKYGNTSSASVPIALDEAVRAGVVREGMSLLFCALGAGFSWGAATVRW